MKITYKFADGTISEVEVSEDLGEFILESRRVESCECSSQHYYCPYSIDQMLYEGMQVADGFDVDTYLIEKEEALLAPIEAKRVRAAFKRLTPVQKRRLHMLKNGLSLRRISQIEGVDIKTLRESIEGAKKKFLKFYKNTPLK